MKIVVVSDSHGNLSNFLELLKLIDYDLVIHLGDLTDDARLIKAGINKDLIYVRGNCDSYDLETKEEEVLEVAGKKIFISHGHKYNVKENLNRIYYRGQELGADLVLFGHTHIPYIRRGHPSLFNPGSLSLPRFGQEATYGVLEIFGEEIRMKIKEI